MAVLLLTLFITFSGQPGAARIPDCLYVAYGCEYYIWDLGDGRGEALVTCDAGGTFSSYSGLMGYCPHS